MPRQIEFDQDNVMETTLNLFWERGYNGTSISDIVKATSVQPGSLYNFYDGKAELFSRCLQQYADQNLNWICGYLQSPGAPLTRLQELLHALTARVCEDQGRRGCMLLNSLVEFSGQDTPINRVILAELDKIRAAIYEVIDESRQVGEIPSESDSAKLSNYVLNNMLGLRLFARLNPSGADRRQLVAQIIRGLRAVG